MQTRFIMRAERDLKLPSSSLRATVEVELLRSDFKEMGGTGALFICMCV